MAESSILRHCSFEKEAKGCEKVKMNIKPTHCFFYIIHTDAAITLMLGEKQLTIDILQVKTFCIS